MLLKKRVILLGASLTAFGAVMAGAAFASQSQSISSPASDAVTTASIPGRITCGLPVSSRTAIVSTPRLAT